MATILVDYENVAGTYGLNGVEYLVEDDELIIFYSGSCHSIRRDDSERIENSGCTFKICALERSRKNALDFYIATEAGCSYMSGEKHIIIVTNDQGFKSIQDYFQIKDRTVQLIIASTIEQGLMKLNAAGEFERKRAILDRNEKVLLSDVCARIDERRAIKRAVIERLAGTEYAGEVSRVLSCIEQTGTESMIKLYQGSLHEFGRESGIKIYNMLKQVV